MTEVKIARVSEREVLWLHLLRNLPSADQEYLVELAITINQRRRRSMPGNVILLSDPFRKFPKKRQ